MQNVISNYKTIPKLTLHDSYCKNESYYTKSQRHTCQGGMRHYGEITDYSQVRKQHVSFHAKWNVFKMLKKSMLPLAG